MKRKKGNADRLTAGVWWSRNRWSCVILAAALVLGLYPLMRRAQEKPRYMGYVLAELCGGGLIFGAFFMATDYVTSPITPRGQIIFGVCLGILTGLFRIFGGSAEGVSYAIIFCNMLVPLIERVTIPTAFGKGGKKHGGK